MRLLRHLLCVRARRAARPEVCARPLHALSLSWTTVNSQRGDSWGSGRVSCLNIEGGTLIYYSLGVIAASPMPWTLHVRYTSLSNHPDPLMNPYLLLSKSGAKWSTLSLSLSSLFLAELSPCRHEPCPWAPSLSTAEDVHSESASRWSFGSSRCSAYRSHRPWRYSTLRRRSERAACCRISRRRQSLGRGGSVRVWRKRCVRRRWPTHVESILAARLDGRSRRCWFRGSNRPGRFEPCTTGTTGCEFR